jgi:hypothetical protein
MSDNNKENNVGVFQAPDKICPSSIAGDKLRLDQSSLPEPLISERDHVLTTAPIQPQGQKVPLQQNSPPTDEFLMEMEMMSSRPFYRDIKMTSEEKYNARQAILEQNLKDKPSLTPLPLLGRPELFEVQKLVIRQIVNDPMSNGCITLDQICDFSDAVMDNGPSAPPPSPCNSSTISDDSDSSSMEHDKLYNPIAYYRHKNRKEEQSSDDDWSSFSLSEASPFFGGNPNHLPKGKEVVKEQSTNVKKVAVSKIDKFNKNAEEFAKDPWAKPNPSAFRTVLDDNKTCKAPVRRSANLLPDSFGDTSVRGQEKLFSDSKKENRDRTRKNEKHNRTISQGVVLHKDTISGKYKPGPKITLEGDDSTTENETPPLDETDELSEQGEDFELPDKIMVESYPFYNNVITLISTVKLVFYSYKTMNSMITSLLDYQSATVSYAIAMVTALKLLWGFYLLFQTHYLTPYVSVYLVKTGDEKPCVKRHFRNQMSTQTPAVFQDYVYKPTLQLPNKHWIYLGFRYVVNKTVQLVTTASDAVCTKFGWNKISIPFLPKMPSEVSLPAFMRVEDMTKFYTQDNGRLNPKRETVNKDLFHRVLTTKALNNHQPIEQQMKTITALINNQSDVNHSTSELKQSTVTSTLTVMKFHILNETEKVAVLGFDQASANLKTNMDTGTIRLIHGGGRISLRTQKPPLNYEPLTILVCGFLNLALFSVILGLPIVAFRYHIRTFLTQSLQSLEKLKDPDLRPPLLFSVLDLPVENASTSQDIVGWLLRKLCTGPLQISLMHGGSIRTTLRHYPSLVAATVDVCRSDILTESTQNSRCLTETLGTMIVYLYKTSTQKMLLDGFILIDDWISSIKEMSNWHQAGLVLISSVSYAQLLIETTRLSIVARMARIGGPQYRNPALRLFTWENDDEAFELDFAEIMDLCSGCLGDLND